MRSIWKVAAAALMATTMIGASHAAPAGWQSCAVDTKDSVTISEAGVSYSIPRWALKRVSKDLGVSWISDHGLCNEKLHKVVICNPWDEDKDKDPVCTEPSPHSEQRETLKELSWTIQKSICPAQFVTLPSGKKVWFTGTFGSEGSDGTPIYLFKGEGAKVLPGHNAAIKALQKVCPEDD